MKPCWNHVATSIQHFEKKELIDLVKDLYQLSPENKDFFHIRFATAGEEPLNRYKKILRNSLHPCLEEHETLQIERANDVIKRYSKALDNPVGEADLRIFYVECGNNFTLSYGDIDEDFYDALLDMYEYAIETVLECPPEKHKEFQARLKDIMTSASGIGWGYGDGLADLYYEVFDDE